MVKDIDTEDCHGQLFVMEAALWYVPNGINNTVIVVNAGGDRHGRLQVLLPLLLLSTLLVVAKCWCWWWQW